MMPGNGLISDCIEKAYLVVLQRDTPSYTFSKETYFGGCWSLRQLKSSVLWLGKPFSSGAIDYLPFHFVSKSNLHADRSRHLLLKRFLTIPWNTTGRAYGCQVQCGPWVRGIKALREIFLWLIQILVYVHLGGLWNEAFFLGPFVVYVNSLNSRCSMYLLIMTSSTCLRIKHWKEAFYCARFNWSSELLSLICLFLISS